MRQTEYVGRNRSPVGQRNGTRRAYFYWWARPQRHPRQLLSRHQQQSYLSSLHQPSSIINSTRCGVSVFSLKCRQQQHDDFLNTPFLYIKSGMLQQIHGRCLTTEEKYCLNKMYVKRRIYIITQLYVKYTYY